MTLDQIENNRDSGLDEDRVEETGPSPRDAEQDETPSGAADGASSAASEAGADGPAESAGSDAQPEAGSSRTDDKPGQPAASTAGGVHASTSGAEPPTRPGMNWYVLRVASNKEEQVRETLERKIRIENLGDHVGRILVPTAKEKRMKAGQVKVFERKLYPGYVFVEMATEDDGSIPENVWFLVKETTGVGDFIGSDGKPTSMRDHDVEMMLLAAAKPDEEATLQGLEFTKGDRVKIKEGSFQNFEGNVESVDETKGIITVLLTIFGRSTPVDVEYWQLEKV